MILIAMLFQREKLPIKEELKESKNKNFQIHWSLSIEKACRLITKRKSTTTGFSCTKKGLIHLKSTYQPLTHSLLDNQ